VRKVSQGAVAVAAGVLASLVVSQVPAAGNVPAEVEVIAAEHCPRPIVPEPGGGFWVLGDGFHRHGADGEVVDSLTVAEIELAVEPAELLGTVAVAAPDASGSLWFVAGVDEGAGPVTRWARYDGTDVDLFAVGVPTIGDPDGIEEWYPTAMATGPDGLAWFADSYGVVARIEADGDVDLVADRSPRPAQWLAVGPDGQMWSASSQLGWPDGWSEIARFDADEPPASAAEVVALSPEGDEVLGFAAAGGAMWVLSSQGGSEQLTQVSSELVVAEPILLSNADVWDGGIGQTFWMVGTEDGPYVATSHNALFVTPNGPGTDVRRIGDAAQGNAGPPRGATLADGTVWWCGFGVVEPGFPDGHGLVHLDPAAVWTFADVGPTHPFVEHIEWSEREGLVGGYVDSTFRPAAPVSRQAMVTFLHRLAGAPEVEVFDDAFPDVRFGHPFLREVTWAVAEGLTTGYPDGTFRPGAPVSRQAAVAFLHRTAGSPEVVDDGSDAFADVPDTHEFRTEVVWAVHAGITTGYADGTFRPGAPVSRQAAAAFLHRYAEPAPADG
jgi:hypothetical protein